jgi:hypothetical protein
VRWTRRARRDVRLVPPQALQPGVAAHREDLAGGRLALKANMEVDIEQYADGNPALVIMTKGAVKRSFPPCPPRNHSLKSVCVPRGILPFRQPARAPCFQADGVGQNRAGRVNRVSPLWYGGTGDCTQTPGFIERQDGPVLAHQST